MIIINFTLCKTHKAISIVCVCVCVGKSVMDDLSAQAWRTCLLKPIWSTTSPSTWTRASAAGSWCGRRACWRRDQGFVTEWPAAPTSSSCSTGSLGTPNTSTALRGKAHGIQWSCTMLSTEITCFPLILRFKKVHLLFFFFYIFLENYTQMLLLKLNYPAPLTLYSSYHMCL